MSKATVVMDKKMLDRLRLLPPLGSHPIKHLQCKICSEASIFFDIVDFNKICSETNPYHFGASGIPVRYFKCANCGFISAPFFDKWSSDDFAQFIYNSDYPKVDAEYADIRPAREADAIASFLESKKALRILDYGSGSGAFARRLACHGFNNVQSYDPFSSPSAPSGKFDVITCFEVLEHSSSPLKTLKSMADFMDDGACIIFSTGLQPANIDQVRANWWYIAPRNGHISIFTKEALDYLGKKLGFFLHAGAHGLAYLTARSISTQVELIAKLGPSSHIITLGSPPANEPMPIEQSDAWHNVEQHGDIFFRWTRDTRITWRLPEHCSMPGCLDIKIKIVHEVDPAFALGCTIELEGANVPLRRQGNTLVASVAVDRSVSSPFLTLVTPEPIRPSDIRESRDDRKLGLAIATRKALSSELTF